MKKVVLYIAMSLDGFIADSHGEIGWLENVEQSSTEVGSYESFIKTVDTVIIGYKTYNQIVTELSPELWPYPHAISYVITHRILHSNDKVIFTSEPLDKLIGRLKKEKGKNIWICGGSNIVNQLLAKNLIDLYHITLVPVILGSGIRLFNDKNPTLNLKLIKTERYNATIDIVYESK